MIFLNINLWKNKIVKTHVIKNAILYLKNNFIKNIKKCYKNEIFKNNIIKRIKLYLKYHKK